jgi:aspartyl-tRNA(Asn)/glutamyl-tRNA(Gln) amidotransferase subunit A
MEDNYNKTIDFLKKEAKEVKEINYDEKLLKILYPIYQAISFTEAASCNFNLQGVNFGIRGTGNDIVEQARTESFGIEVKKRFAIGSFMLQKENQEKYFMKAKKIRRLVLKEYKRVMGEIDILITPTIIDNPPLIKDVDSFNN